MANNHNEDAIAGACLVPDIHEESKHSEIKEFLPISEQDDDSLFMNKQEEKEEQI